MIMLVRRGVSQDLVLGAQFFTVLINNLVDGNRILYFQRPCQYYCHRNSSTEYGVKVLEEHGHGQEGGRWDIMWRNVSHSLWCTTEKQSMYEVIRDWRVVILKGTLMCCHV